MERNLVVLSKVPPAELRPAMLFDHAIFSRARGTVIAPVVTCVEHAPAFADEFLGVLEAAFLQSDSH
jgi:hypothetical protein